jgi:hypothetical protein
MLSKITLPSNVMHIGEKAFSNCKSLKELVVPETVSVMGRFAFAGCTALTELKIPERFNDQVDDLFVNMEMEDDLDVDLEIG